MDEMLAYQEQQRRDLAFMAGNFAAAGPDPDGPEEVEPPEGE